jgi:hypothetical protein
MAYENIRSDSSAFCSVGDYFYTMKAAPTNSLIQKTGNGDPVMTYPLDHEIDLSTHGTDFLSMQYDGTCFWTLEKNNVSGNLEKERLLRRWKIENLTCVLKNTFRLHSQGSIAENINGKAFAIETYYNQLAEACGPGSSNLDRVILKTPNAAFFHVSDTFHIEIDGSPGSEQDIQVATVPNEYTVYVGTTLDKLYPENSPVILRRGLYFFNNEGPSIGSTSAAVYYYTIPCTSPADPTVVEDLNYMGCHESGIYEQTKSATFITTSGVQALNDGYYCGLIAYVRGQQLLLKLPSLPADSLSYPGNYVGTGQEFRSNIASMIMDDAIYNDRITLHTIYDLSSSIDTSSLITSNIYRLQADYTFGTSEASWTTKNYVVSVTRPMVTSIGLTASPAVVVANSGVDRVLITATVKDQYGYPINMKRVSFQISAATDAIKGYFTTPDQTAWTPGCSTWLDSAPHRSAEVLTGCQSEYLGGPQAMQGQATVAWCSGSDPGMVSIIATVQP